MRTATTSITCKNELFCVFRSIGMVGRAGFTAHLFGCVPIGRIATGATARPCPLARFPRIAAYPAMPRRVRYAGGCRLLPLARSALRASPRRWCIGKRPPLPAATGASVKGGGAFHKEHLRPFLVRSKVPAVQPFRISRQHRASLVAVSLHAYHERIIPNARPRRLGIASPVRALRVSARPRPRRNAASVPPPWRPPRRLRRLRS